MQSEINDTFLFSCKRFIPVSNERLHNFLSHLSFFPRVCFTILCSLCIDCHENEPHACDAKFAPWLGNCWFWFADQNISKVEKLWTGYLTTNPKIKYITLFPQKIILKCSECSDMWNKSLTTQQLRLL